MGFTVFCPAVRAGRISLSAHTYTLHEESARFELASPETSGLATRRNRPLCELSVGRMGIEPISTKLSAWPPQPAELQPEESVGFEPTGPRPGCFQDRYNNPLCHDSIAASPGQSLGFPGSAAVRDVRIELTRLSALISKTSVATVTPIPRGACRN
jgi:hypothetical protein